MLAPDNLDEARAASAAGIDMLSISEEFWSPEMREAAGSCFVQVSLLDGVDRSDTKTDRGQAPGVRIMMGQGLTPQLVLHP